MTKAAFLPIATNAPMAAASWQHAFSTTDPAPAQWSISAREFVDVSGPPMTGVVLFESPGREAIKVSRRDLARILKANNDNTEPSAALKAAASRYRAKSK